MLFLARKRLLKLHAKLNKLYSDLRFTGKIPLDYIVSGADSIRLEKDIYIHRSFNTVQIGNDWLQIATISSKKILKDLYKIYYYHYLVLLIVYTKHTNDLKREGLEKELRVERRLSEIVEKLKEVL